METLIGTLAWPGDLPLAQQIAASAVLFVNVACLVLVRLLRREPHVTKVEEAECDEAA